MKKCTKPNCNCIEIAEQKNGGQPVKSYQCLADYDDDFGQFKNDVQYCNWCQTNTRQVSETTGMRCQKCGNQNPFFNSSSKDYADYLHDLIIRNGIQDWEGLNRYYDDKKKDLSEFMDKVAPLPNSEQADERSVANTPNSSNGDGNQKSDTDVEKLAEEAITNFPYKGSLELFAKEAFIAGYNAAKQTK
jgi:hypothetical protein